MRPRRRRSLAVLPLTLLVAGCLPRPADPAPSIVLITVDTLRADHLGSYGSTVTRTPNIDRLASEGTRFEHVATPMPETRPAHATLFTGRYPRQHGVLSNALTLPADVPTLSERLRAAGYQTAAFVGVGLLDEASGIGRGFERLDSPRDPPLRDADQVVPLALAWLRSRDRARPFLLWVHLFDPHIPYAPPAAFDTRSPAAAKARWPEISWSSLVDTAARNAGDVPAAMVARAKALYAGEVEHADHWVGTLLDGLEADGSAAQTMVVLTADHGECFGNGIYFEHSGCLYDGSIAVPLMVRFPGRVAAGGRRTEQAGLVDLAPTILALAGVAPRGELAGRALFAGDDEPAGAGEALHGAFLQHPLYRAIDAEDRRALLAQLPSVAGEATRAVVADRELLGIRTTRWKYLWTRDGESLYDLADDPGERFDLAPSAPDALARLRRAVRAWRRDHPLRLQDAGALSDALRDDLRALGYL